MKYWRPSLGAILVACLMLLWIESCARKRDSDIGEMYAESEAWAARTELAVIGVRCVWVIDGPNQCQLAHMKDGKITRLDVYCTTGKGCVPTR